MRLQGRAICEDLRREASASSIPAERSSKLKLKPPFNNKLNASILSPLAQQYRPPRPKGQLYALLPPRQHNHLCIVQHPRPHCALDTRHTRLNTRDESRHRAIQLSGADAVR